MALCSFKHAFSPMTGRQRLLLLALKDQRILQMMLCKVHTMFKLRLMMMIITLRKEQTVHSAMDAMEVLHCMSLAQALLGKMITMITNST